MTKTLSLRKDWDFVSKDTEISVGKFVLHHFTPLTLGERTGIASDEETVEIWTESQKETMNKVRDNKQRTARTESPVLDEKELERSFCLNRPDGWVVNRNIKRIVLPEFKRTDDSSESYYLDMRKAVEKQHTPIQTGLNS
jgi:hypothetical protein